MAKISYAQYQELLTDPDTPDEVIAAFITFEGPDGERLSGDAAFDPVFMADPERVDMTEFQVEAESAMRIGNGIARWRRNQRFRRALRSGDPRPVLVAEGDSWFQFPIVIRETIDHLGEHYLIHCLSAAGDTAQNMVFGHLGRGGQEYLAELDGLAGQVRAFLFSAAGNDIIGEDIEAGDGTPVLSKLLRSPSGAPSEPEPYIDQAAVTARLGELDRAYRHVITQIRSRPHFRDLPILVHGYDVPYPHPWGAQDRRNPRWAAKDQWLGRAFVGAGINGPVRQLILRSLINQLYAMLERLAVDDAHVHVVDCRGALPEIFDWADEIHATSTSYAAVAGRFRERLSALGIG